MIGRGGMAKRSVAILGGRGMLGTDVATACTQRGLDVRVYDLPEFDLTVEEQVKKAVEGADTIINCAAYTNVDGAESHAELAHRVNAEAVGRLGKLAVKSGKWVLHFSTDFVFDGMLDRPYTEADTPNPINEYGRSKLAGERFLDASRCPCCIVRLQWTYGLHGPNFITKLLDRARSGQALKVVNDQVGSPTATSEVAEVVCTLLERRTEGLFHLAAAGYASRFEVARFIIDRLGLNVSLEPCRTSDYSSPADRPLNSRFNCDKIQRVLSKPLDNWQGPLERFLRQL
jgi:dTDP-4-dehydrorhamnose reductase